MSSLKRTCSSSPASKVLSSHPTAPESVSTLSFSQLGPNVESKDEKLKSKVSSLDETFSKIVWIKIGSSTTPFAVHRNLLVEASPFFRNALSKLNVETEADDSYFVTPEAGSHMVHFPGESYEVFERFNHYLYTQKQLLRQGEKADDLSWTHLFDVHIFALKRQIPSLQNAIVDISIKKHAEGKNLPSPHEINRLYRVGIKAPNFRDLFIDLFIKDCDLENTLRNNRNYHPQFLTAMLIKLHLMNKKAEEDGEGKGKGKRHKIKRDRYHVPEEEE